MNIHEYQAKQIFKENNIRVLDGYPAFCIEDVEKIIDEHFPSGECVIKAQIHAGGRGKAGGVKLAKNKAEALEIATNMFGMKLVTVQTGTEGKIVNKLYLEQTAKYEDEFYLSLTIDTINAKCTFIACLEGGTSIEETAENHPEKIHKLPIETSVGFDIEQANKFVDSLGFKDDLKQDFLELLNNMYKLFIARDCSLIEINPLALIDNKFYALDAKINFDSGADFRHIENTELIDLSEENPLEVEASKYGMSYVSLEGNIGCICNGAGLGMSSMDTINYYGGHPANFLDCGGSITVEKAHKAFELVTQEKGVEGIVVNIFGGIARTNLIAEGIVEAINDLKYSKPVVVRIEGNGQEAAHEILKTAPSNVHIADSCSKACEKIINLLEAK